MEKPTSAGELPDCPGATASAVPYRNLPVESTAMSAPPLLFRAVVLNCVSAPLSSARYVVIEPDLKSPLALATNKRLPAVAKLRLFPTRLYGDPETALTFEELSTRMP